MTRSPIPPDKEPRPASMEVMEQLGLVVWNGSWRRDGTKVYVPTPKGEKLLKSLEGRRRGRRLASGGRR